MCKETARRHASVCPVVGRRRDCEAQHRRRCAPNLSTRRLEKNTLKSIGGCACGLPPGGRALRGQRGQPFPDRLPEFQYQAWNLLELWATVAQLFPWQKT
jgi:hypothetical protein